jgi:hypothetical protein
MYSKIDAEMSATLVVSSSLAKRRRLLNRAWPLVVSVGLCGCANQYVADANNITLQDALTDTVDALYAAHKENALIHQRDKKLTHGIDLFVCNVTAKFNVDAKAAYDQKLSLTAGGPPITIIPVSLGGTVSNEATGSGERTNTVTVLLATKYNGTTLCSSKGSAGAGAPAPAPGG